MAKIDRKNINMDKVWNYPTVNEVLDNEYGIISTTSRQKFPKLSQTILTGIIIEDANKNAHLSNFTSELKNHFFVVFLFFLSLTFDFLK